MPAFLIIKDSKNRQTQNSTEIFNALEDLLKISGSQVFTKYFAFESALPIISNVNNNKIDYLVIDLPNRIKLDELIRQIVFDKDDIKNLGKSESLTTAILEKKVRIPGVIVFTEKSSINIQPDKIPIFVDDIITKDSELKVVMTRLLMIVKRYGMSLYEENRNTKLLKMFDSSGLIMLELDFDFSITFLNKRAKDFFGWLDVERVSKNFFDLTTKDKGYRDSLEGIFKSQLKKANGSKFEFESLITDKSSKYQLIRWVGEIIENENMPNTITLVGYEDKSERLIVEQTGNYAKEITQRNEKLTETVGLYKKELKMAKRIQNGIIPKKFPKIEGVKVNAMYVPMDDVGGDFYDFFLFDSSFGFLICDVVGHGVPAALVTSMIKVLSHNYSGRLVSPKDFFKALNCELNSLLVPGSFLTMFGMYYDNRTKSLRYSSGGHPDQILYRKRTNEIVLLKSAGTILGVISDSEYEHYEVRNIENGDRLIMFTDGIIEAKNMNNELFGMEKLVESIQRNYSKEIEEFKQSILKEVADFSAGMPVSDDVSLVVLEFID